MAKEAKQIHREWYERRLAEIDLLPKIPCECGCGTMIAPIDVNNKARKFEKGHATKGKKKPAPSVYPNGLGRPLTPAERTQRSREKKRAEIESMPKIPCKCGCGTMIAPINTNFKPAEYAHGHNPHGENTRFAKGQDAWNKGMTCEWASITHKGKVIPEEQKARAAATRLANNNGVWQIKRGWKHKPETVAKMKIAVNQRDLSGINNPFYGKKHTPETIAKISGENNPNWEGGASFVRYGAGFTPQLKEYIKDRDGRTCQRCGVDETQYRFPLQVHHLDHDKSNHSLDNLVCSCGKCNMWASKHRDEPFITQAVWERTHETK